MTMDSGQGMVDEISVAAAVAVVDYNLLSNSKYRQLGHNRRIRGLAVCGSAAAGDTIVALYVGRNEVGRFYNLATGFPTRDHMRSINHAVPGNAEVSLIVVDAPATNPLNASITYA